MECWYDSLFECDCAGIDAITSVKCAGTVNTITNYRQPSGLITPLGEPINRSLAKRIKWITECASVSVFQLVVFDDWKTNKFRIFIRVTAIREYYVKEGQTLWRTIDLIKPSCYYLGRYPWHWDYEHYQPKPPAGDWIGWDMPKEASDLITKAPREKWTGPQLGPYEGPTGGTGLPVEYLPHYSEEEFTFFHGRQKYTNYSVQSAFQEWLNTRLKNCIAQNYPPPGWTPKRTVKTPQGEWEWPGKPIKELDPPIPMGRRALPPGIEQTTVNVTTALYFSPVGREDGLTLDLEIT